MLMIKPKKRKPHFALEKRDGARDAVFFGFLHLEPLLGYSQRFMLMVAPDQKKKG